jgi:hypothetical protein
MVVCKRSARRANYRGLIKRAPINVAIAITAGIAACQLLTTASAAVAAQSVDAANFR